MRPSIYYCATWTLWVGYAGYVLEIPHANLAHSLDPALIPEKVHDSWKDHPRSVVRNYLYSFAYPEGPDTQYLGTWGLGNS